MRVRIVSWDDDDATRGDFAWLLSRSAMVGAKSKSMQGGATPEQLNVSSQGCESGEDQKVQTWLTRGLHELTLGKGLPVGQSHGRS
jgi:hypothetical protein